MSSGKMSHRATSSVQWFFVRIIRCESALLQEGKKKVRGYEWESDKNQIMQVHQVAGEQPVIGTATLIEGSAQAFG